MTEEIVLATKASSKHWRRRGGAKSCKRKSAGSRISVCDENAMIEPAHTARMTKADSESWPVCAVWSQ